MLFRILPWLMSALMALSSATMATARGHVVQGDAIVICSGYGVVTILVGPDGEPLGAVHPCPDCTPHLALVLPPAAPPVVQALTRAEPLRSVVLSVVLAAVSLPPQARAPPFA